MNNAKTSLSDSDSSQWLIKQENNQNKIRIFLVDDQNSILQMLDHFLSSEPDLQVIGSSKNSQSALKQIEALSPDIAIIDIEMPGLNGLAMTGMIHEHFTQTKVLVLSSYDQTEYIQQALKAGAKGYLLKNTPRDELVYAVRFIHKGYLQLGPGLYEKLESERIVSESKLASNSVLAQDASEQPSKIDPYWTATTQQKLDSLPAVWSRAIIYLMTIFAAVILPWAMLSQVDVIASARGKLEPKGKTVRLDAPVSGTVVNINIKEGQQISKGQSLIKLESDLVNADLFQQQRKLEGQQHQLNQLILLKNQQKLVLQTQQQQNQAQQSEKQSQIEQAQQNLNSLQASYNSQLAEKKAQVEQAQEAITASQAAYKLAQIRRDSAREKMPRYRQAYEDGAISQDRFLEAEQQLQESQENMRQALSEIAQAQSRLNEQESGYEKLIQQTLAEIKQTKLRAEEQEKSYQTLVHANNIALLNTQKEIDNFDAQISNVKTEIAQTHSLIDSLEYQLNQRVIYAPIEGTIFQLPIQKAGAVVQPGQMLAQLAPKGVPLIIRAKIDSSESGFLKVGLPVNLKFDAYPFQDYGVIPGRLIWISPDSRLGQNQPEQASTQTEFFELEIELERTLISTGDRLIQLTPGQTATAEIIIRQRRVIDLILDPFKRLRQTGLQM
ncbi:response regulator receiver protein [Stanieria cyanosphaera PCC 7437]|uniref:Response regulator receiver protein n=1 Tax=Stanieria cyanosphaera (strain ATCC 29371 / PCC 7437) TaxID=111780 RepID=K9XVY4_STAC7|nr:response regulator [Stanieria cyanosphaera]AFZ36750.1 response regulator receiver protein [Stanieria cyanosphaera PCC 7437]